jgi:hypothetical protein
VAPTVAGVFVVGYPRGSQDANLYRVQNGALELVKSSSNGAIFAIPPFSGS